jgi:hypothetical protein
MAVPWYAYGPERSRSLGDLAIVVLAIATCLLTARTPLIFLAGAFPSSTFLYTGYDLLDKITSVSLIDAGYGCCAWPLSHRGK